MASPLELDIDCKTNGYSMLVNSSGDEFQQTLYLKEFLDRLEEERLKIEAFKRELPLCMQLLNNAVEALRQQLESYQAKQGTRPVLEEFIPLKNSTAEPSEKASNTSEKTSWMTTAQLWSHADDGSECKAAKTPSVEEFERGLSTIPKLSLDHKERNGGAFLPFSKERSLSANPSEIAWTSVNKEIEEKKCFGLENRMSHRIGENSKGISGTAVERGKGTGNASEVKATLQTQRKARRCWSPELHHRFVNALRVLGGSEVATPKQIRELMKVDGLTNDEVKSHLQKYRLHTRRPGPTSPSPATQAPHLVFLGGIWVPPEYAAAPTIYGPHPTAMAHYCSPVPQDFYPVPPHHYHPYNNAPPQTQSSPESNDRDAGGRSESMEEGGKSESESWKGRRSGKEEGMVARGLLSLRDSGEEEGESHASGITLKI